MSQRVRRTHFDGSTPTLFVKPVELATPGRLGWAQGLRERNFTATGSKRFCGITLPGNGVLVQVVPCRTSVAGSYMVSGLGLACPPKVKSPLSMAGVGTLAKVPAVAPSSW